MTKLYSKWAWVYHEMYGSIFDYGKDFFRFNSTLEIYRCRSILELGCGSGNLAQLFLAAGYRYAGLDIAPAMLAIARQENPGARFKQGDMRRFSVRKKVDSVLVAGRSFSYMTTNRDVFAALKSIQKALKPGGILIFDNFDAARIFASFPGRMRDDIRHNGRHFVRLSETSPNLGTGWTWNWDASYVVDDGERKRAFYDRSLLRAFTPDELRLFLTLAGFEPLRISRRAVTILAVARKP